jgi:hypothetical protein
MCVLLSEDVLVTRSYTYIVKLDFYASASGLNQEPQRWQEAVPASIKNLRYATVKGRNSKEMMSVQGTRFVESGARRKERR